LQQRRIKRMVYLLCARFYKIWSN